MVEGLADFAGELFKKNKYDIDAHYIDIDQTPRQVGKFIKEGAKVLIARGGVVTIIKQSFSVPIINLKYNFLEFFEPIKKAYEISDKVALMGWYNSIDNFNKYKALLSTSLHYVELSPTTAADCEDYIYREVKKVVEMGIKVVVGGGGVVRAAKRLNIPYVHVDISEQAYLDAADEALYNLYIYEENLRRNEIITAVLNNVFEGALTIDSGGYITSCNNIARRILNLPKHENNEKILLSQYFPRKDTIENAINGKKLVNQFFTINNNQVVLNAEPLYLDKQITGSIITLQETDTILNLEKKILKNAVASGHYAKYCFDDIVGGSYAMSMIKDKAQKYAASNSPVLILGESGTGKEIFAQSIHNASTRKNNPFVAINCAALPESILESELFGYVKGAFTGARNEGKKGIFEMAHKGTIFLDEIGEFSPKVQARLLRVLQEKEISRIGDDKIIPVDVRIIAATNKDLWKAMEDGSFREDLYYRINVLNLTLPPLRERREDIMEMIERLTIRAGFSKKTFALEAIEIILDQKWRGNIRELNNFIERLEVMSIAETITLNDVCQILELPFKEKLDYRISNGNSIQKVDGKYILHMLKQNYGNKKKTAKDLGISTATLWRRLKEIKEKIN
jgi:transcriptional regulator with PAS, ATPase and Fis domain